MFHRNTFFPRFFSFLLVFSPLYVFADTEITVEPLLQSISEHIINPIIVFLFAVAFIYFLFGIFQFVAGMNSEEAREKGKRHLIWGIVGLFIMFGVYGIILILLNSLGIETSGLYIFGS